MAARPASVLGARVAPDRCIVLRYWMPDPPAALPSYSRNGGVDPHSRTARLCQDAPGLPTLIPIARAGRRAGGGTLCRPRRALRRLLYGCSPMNWLAQLLPPFDSSHGGSRYRRRVAELRWSRRRAPAPGGRAVMPARRIGSRTALRFRRTAAWCRRAHAPRRWPYGYPPPTGGENPPGGQDSPPRGCTRLGEVLAPARSGWRRRRPGVMECARLRRASGTGDERPTPASPGASVSTSQRLLAGGAVERAVPDRMRSACPTGPTRQGGARAAPEGRRRVVSGAFGGPPTTQEASLARAPRSDSGA